MSVISLSKAESDVFPEEINGYAINPHFRNILWILRLLSDEGKTPLQRTAYALRNFYVDEIPEENAAQLLYEFLNAGQSADDDDREPPQMDFEFDADEIYSDFLREYKIDLFKSNMHWYRFLALLSGLSDKSALSRKIQIRTRDLSGLKGKDRMEAERAKARVQIPVKLTEEEKAQAAAFEDMWGNI